MLSATRFGLLAAALAVVPQIAPAQSLSAEEILKRIQQQREVLATQPKEDPATRTIRPVPVAPEAAAPETTAESVAVVSTQPSRQPATQTQPETAVTTPVAPEVAQIVPAAVTESLPVMSDEMSINLVVFFEFNSAILKPEARDELNKLCQALALDTGSYEIIGHTDAAGSDEYNLILSRARAEAVVEHLVSRCDIAEDRLRAHGMGEKRLRNSTLPRDSVNRRVEIQVSS
ncbi:MAG: OmpA family protein [Pseudomonadota bacterium]